MSLKIDEDIKRRAAQRQGALVLDIIQGKTTVSEASRSYDLSPSEVERPADDAERGMENALCANPLMSENNTSVRSRTDKRRTAKRCWSHAPEKSAVPFGRGREIIEAIRHGLKGDGYTVSISTLCQRFGIPRRTAYYKAVKAAPKVNPELAEPIKSMMKSRLPSATGQWLTY